MLRKAPGSPAVWGLAGESDGQNLPKFLPAQRSRGLLALTALDLRVDLIRAGIKQLDGLILQLPHVTVRMQHSLIRIDTFAGDQFRGFDSNGRRFCYHHWLCRAGRQAKAEKPNHEPACCCA